jgi:hypothetical protein
MRPAPALIAGALLAFGAFATGTTRAGEPGRLEEDADFLLGSWSTDCSSGQVDVFLSDGALRQRGLLRIANKEGGDPVTPVTLLAATRDGHGLVLEAVSEGGDFPASARYTASVEDGNTLSLESLTLCRAARCRSIQLGVPWRRCPG